MPLAASVGSLKREKGSALIEFLFVSVLLIVPLLLGTMILGMRLVRANQVSEVCRDAGHMYAYYVDFSQPSGQNLLVTLAQGLNMTVSGGNGVVILSTITVVGSNDCITGGYPSGTCPNLNSTVFTRRVLVGNPQLSINGQLQVSVFGTPDPSIIDGEGNINPSYYAANPTAVANNFSSVIALSTDQYAYLAEAFFLSPDFNLLSPGGIAARSVF
jgi:hypothetical protein